MSRNLHRCRWMFSTQKNLILQEAVLLTRFFRGGDMFFIAYVLLLRYVQFVLRVSYAFEGFQDFAGIFSYDRIVAQAP